MTTNELTQCQHTMTRLDEIASAPALTAAPVTTGGHPFTQAPGMAEAIKAIRAALPDEVMNDIIGRLKNIAARMREIVAKTGKEVAA
ncbi:hypothetical protein [Luteolibacter luteus]|uniref:Uncharacterized protein n=1 Tax=Luteolibacter luteus TaxID=2728835 RepID=A0A858RRQ1_9BACT|nr:hypothetical protein [Luteolibacter luteus]QJE99098.1 hypothetical protein HHL09_26070 [Luteolibacter luteus]